MSSYDNKLPVYVHIKKYIEDNIMNGTWVAHHRIPPEEELCEQFRVSRGTVRQALTELAHEGRIVKVRGKGTFVRPQGAGQNISGTKFLSFLGELTKQKIKFATRRSELTRVAAEPEMAGLLDLPADNRDVFRLYRERSIDGRVFMVIYNHVPAYLFPGLDSCGLDFNDSETSLYEYLESQYHVTMDWANKLFSAVGADAGLSSVFEVAEGAPVVHAEQIVYTDTGRCIDYAVAYFHGDKLRMSVFVKRNQR